LNILAIGAHPDDIEEGCAGYLIKKQAQGHRIGHCLVTDGSNRGLKEIRDVEQKNALNKFPSTVKSWSLEYVDCLTEGNLQDIIEDLEKIINEFKPDIIFTHFPEDTHHDHRLISKATLEAGRYKGRIFFYESAITRGFEPTHYCDITSHIDTKMEIISCFESQREVIGIKGVKALALYRAIQSKQEAKFSESFKAYRDIL